jgi:hypothetical protein
MLPPSQEIGIHITRFEVNMDKRLVQNQFMLLRMSFAQSGYTRH